MEPLTGSDFMTANSQGIDEKKEDGEGLTFFQRLKYFEISEVADYHLKRAAGFAHHKPFFTPRMFLPGGDMTMSRMSRLDIHPWSLMEIGFIAFGEQPENYWKTGALFAGVYGGRHILRSAGLIKGPVKRKFRPGNRKLLKKEELSEVLFDWDETLARKAVKGEKGIGPGLQVELPLLKKLVKKTKPKNINFWSNGIGGWHLLLSEKYPKIAKENISARGLAQDFLYDEPVLHNLSEEFLTRQEKPLMDYLDKIYAEKSKIDPNYSDANFRLGKKIENLEAFPVSKERARAILVDDAAEVWHKGLGSSRKRNLLPEEFEKKWLNKGKVIAKEEGIFIKSGEEVLKRGERLFKAATRAKPFSRAASLLIAGSILAEVSKPAVISGIKHLQNAVNTTMQHTHLDFGGTQMNIPMEAYNERNEALQRIQDARMQASYLFGNESQRYHG